MVSVLIQIPESLLLETILPFPNKVKVSTAGLEAATAQVKVANMSVQTLWLMDRLVIKVTVSGASE